MKTISTALEAALTGGSICYCWKLTRIDGTVMGFTSCGEDVVFEGVTYSAALGPLRSAIESSIEQPTNMVLEIALDDLGITAADIRAGVYRNADLRVFKVNYAATSQGNLKLGRTKFGALNIQDGMVRVSLLGLAAQLDQYAIVDVTSPGCRANLGDLRCRKDLTDFTDTGMVTAVDSRKAFTATVSTARATGFHSLGRLRFDTGLNAGPLWYEVSVYTSPDIFVMYLDLPYAPEIDDTFTVIAGCDLTKTTCIDKFDNLVNRQAEDFLAGLDSALETPNAN